MGFKRQFMTTYGNLFPPIYDYTDDIKRLSNQIMDSLKTNVVASMNKMNFVVNPMLKQQIDSLKVQICEDFYVDLQERFSGRLDNITDKLEKEVKLFNDVYQLYTFAQSQTVDSFVKLNDRFEYETLWRYPTASRLEDIIISQSNSHVKIKLDSFSNFEQLSEDVGKEYTKYGQMTGGNSEQRTLRMEIVGNLINDFYNKGAVHITLNPSDQNCMNCFNARLVKALIETDGDIDADFLITHLGPEMQTKIENGYRKFETIKNTPETHELVHDKVLEGLKDRSPFAGFLIELKENYYWQCRDKSETEKEMCKYELRKQ